MDSNVYSTEPPVGLAALESVVEALAARDLTRLTDGQAAARVLALRGLLERLEGQWLRQLAPRPPGGARRRLQLPELRPAAGLVRGAPSSPLAAWRADRPGQPGAAVPHPSSCRARGRLADPPSSRWEPHRGATASKTGARGASRDG